jgi:hypothetical protein
VSRGGIIDIVNEIVTQINPMTFVDLQNPLYTVYIDVVNSIVCLSVLSNFSKYRKYNLLEVAIPRPPSDTEKRKAGVQTSTVDKTASADDLKPSEEQPTTEDVKDQNDQLPDESAAKKMKLQV